jgi:small subunit ribosomal protein S4
MKYRGPRLRVIRRFQRLQTSPSQSTLYPFRKPPTRPGQHGRKPIKPTQFGIRLLEKQKLRFYYGVSEKQMINYIKRARKAHEPTDQKLLQFLEERLDSVLYKAGLRRTIREARSRIVHGNVLVNGARVVCPSYRCVAPISLSLRGRKDKPQTHHMKFEPIKSHAPVRKKKISGENYYVLTPNDGDFNINIMLVVEYYSNRL